MQILKYLSTPFPRPEKNRKNLLWIILVGLGSSFFILVYEPFGIENTTGEWFVDIIIFSLGIVFIISVLFMEWLIPKLFPQLFKKWTLGKAIAWYTMVFLFVGVVMFLYKSYLAGFRDFTFQEFLLVLARICGIGITVSFFVLGIWNYINRKKISLITSGENYTITASNGKSIQLNLKDIVFIASDDNYIDIHFLSQGQRKKEVLRSSLKNVEAQIANPLSPIYRCHRRYLINTEYFKILKMNSRTMTIGLDNHPDQIPVSKQYAEEIAHHLQFRH